MEHPSEFTTVSPASVSGQSSMVSSTPSPSVSAQCEERDVKSKKKIVREYVLCCGIEKIYKPACMCERKRAHAGKWGKLIN